MNSLMLLWKNVANQFATWCCTCATMDVTTVHRRFKHEGLSFLTITLPAFGKDFERCLDQGRVDHAAFQGFGRHRGLPRFLGGFLDLVFDRSSGELLDEPSVEAIHALRQLTLMFGKILVPCSDARLQDAMDRFLECEQEVRDSDRRLSPVDSEAFRRVARLLYFDMMTELDQKVWDRTIIPKHGPGATADRLRGNAKFRQRTWPMRLESTFPFGEFAIPNFSFREEIGAVDFLEPGREIPVRVVSVPKTLKTPRIIAIEPTAMQYAQQAIDGALREGIKQDSFLRDFVGLDDQTPNQKMAKEGSLYGNLATLDLSEASDRVSNQHVLDLFSDHPYLSGAVQDCRSRKADVQGKTVRLAKFASMGSALCFPVEAMVFLTIIFLGIEQELNSPLDRETIDAFRGKVRVYGDDIIIPVDYVDSVVNALERFGAKVNMSKSFWTGRFRESCGKEYYNGHDVSITRVRRLIPTQRTDAAGVISTISLRNQLYWAGLWKASAWLDDLIRGVIRYYPVVDRTSPVLGRESVLPYQAERFHRTLHTPLVKGWVVSSKPPRDHLEGPDALLKCLLALEARQPARDPKVSNWFPLPQDASDHLERSGRPQTVDIKLRNGTPY